MDESGPVDSKTSHFVSLELLTSKLNFYLDRGFQRESMLSGPPWQRTWVGAEIGAAERKTRAAAGQTEPALFPLQHQRCSPGRVPPSERSQTVYGASMLCLHRCLPPREAQALQTCVTTCFQEMDAHICRLPRGETEAHSGAGRGFRAEQTQGGEPEGQAGVGVPHWPLWLPGCLCLVKPALDRDKTLDFSLPETAAASSTTELKLEPRLSGGGAGQWPSATPVQAALPAVAGEPG